MEILSHSHCILLFSSNPIVRNSSIPKTMYNLIEMSACSILLAIHSQKNLDDYCVIYVYMYILFSYNIKIQKMNSNLFIFKKVKLAG